MPTQRTKKTSISLDPDLLTKAKTRAEGLGFKNSFSAYVAKLINEDLHQQSAPGISGGRISYLNESAEKKKATGRANRQ